MSDRRLGTLASLLGLTLLVYAMIGFRIVYSGNLNYGALIWNLFLAWIPFALALFALQRASAASVASVRETSVVIAVALAAPFLGEQVGPRRLAGAALVVAGVAVLAGA